METWKGYTSVVERLNTDLVRKVFKKEYIWMVSREEEALKRLNKYKNFPKLISIGGNYIEISYCGIQAKQLDKKQCLEVLSALKESKIVHRDIMPRNLLSKDRTIYLIDFGWCLFDGEKESPVIAPKRLGRHYYEHNKWNDEKAMQIIFAEMKI